jgi:hypothetical protein
MVFIATFNVLCNFGILGGHLCATKFFTSLYIRPSMMGASGTNGVTTTCFTIY